MKIGDLRSAYAQVPVCACPNVLQLLHKRLFHTLTKNDTIPALHKSVHSHSWYNEHTRRHRKWRPFIAVVKRIISPKLKFSDSLYLLFSDWSYQCGGVCSLQVNLFRTVFERGGAMLPGNYAARGWARVSGLVYTYCLLICV